MKYRALRVYQPGTEFKLSLEEEAAKALTDGEVRLRITSTGLNRADLLYPQNRYFIKPAEGSRIGFEGAGEVIETAANSRFKLGDKVTIMPMSVSPTTQGCIAEEGIFKEDQLFLSPALSDESIQGGIWMAYLTAWGGLFDAGQLKADQNLLISAASSSVGIAAIQLAKQAGATVLATTTSQSKRQALLDQGADEVLIHPRESSAFEEFEAAILQATQGKGLDLSFDAVAGPAVRCLIKSSKKGGRVVIQGLLDRRPMDVHAGVLMKRALLLRGFTLNDTLDQEDLRDEALNTISIQLEKGNLKPLIHKTYDLDDYETAFSDLSSNQHTGKLVITN